MYKKDKKNLSSRKYEIKKQIVENKQRIGKLTIQIEAYIDFRSNKQTIDSQKNYNHQMAQVNNQKAPISKPSMRTKEREK